MKKYRCVALGGTFDRLHAGHREFISRAFELGERVIIGLTSDSYIDNIKYKKSNIPTPLSHSAKVFDPEGLRPRRAPWDKKLRGASKNKVLSFLDRKEQVEAFLRDNGWLQRVEIVAIDDVYGPAVEHPEIQAIVVTKDSHGGAKEINRKRQSLGFSPLKIEIVHLVPAGDHRTISSTRIRMGEIDRWGHVLSALPLFNEKITPSLRAELKKPQGIFIAGKREDLHAVVPRLREVLSTLDSAVGFPLIITVGDEVTRLANELGLNQGICVIDFKVERRSKYKTLQELGFRFSEEDAPELSSGKAQLSSAPSDFFLQSIRNTPGKISKRLVLAIRRAIKTHFSLGKRHIIRVYGEDDLAALPAILLAPLGTVVLYGQPGEGIVVVHVTEDLKDRLVHHMN